MDNPLNSMDSTSKSTDSPELTEDSPIVKACIAFTNRLWEIHDAYDARILKGNVEEYKKSVLAAYFYSLKAFSAAESKSVRSAYDVARHKEYRANKRNTLTKIMEKLDRIEARLVHQGL